MAKRKRKSKYRSGFEEDIAVELGPEFKYEVNTFTYNRPQKYKVDFSAVKKNGYLMHIETKGRFLSADRTKMLLVQQTYPGIDLRLVFMKDLPLYKGSNSTYSDWAKTHNFRYSVGHVPKAWLKEVKKA